MILHLLRHGQTLANEQRLYCGSTDVPLSLAGEQGIRALAGQGIYPAPHGLALYTSGMLRARQTLALMYGDVPHTALPGFAEMNFGDFEMKSYERLRHDPRYIAWIEDQTEQVACPGGESAAMFTGRVLRAFDQLKKQGQSALLVCHGGVITRLMQRLFLDEPKHFYQWQPGPGEGYSLLYAPDGSLSYHSIPLRAGRFSSDS